MSTSFTCELEVVSCWIPSEGEGSIIGPQFLLDKIEYLDGLPDAQSFVRTSSTPTGASLLSVIRRRPSDISDDTSHSLKVSEAVASLQVSLDTLESTESYKSHTSAVKRWYPVKIGLADTGFHLSDEVLPILDVEGVQIQPFVIQQCTTDISIESTILSATHDTVALLPTAEVAIPLLTSVNSLNPVKEEARVQTCASNPTHVAASVDPSSFPSSTTPSTSPSMTEISSTGGDVLTLPAAVPLTTKTVGPHDESGIPFISSSSSSLVLTAQETWHVVGVAVRTGTGDCFLRFLRYSETNTAAKELIVVFRGMVEFINHLKVFFMNMRSTLMQAEALQKHWLKDMETAKQNLGSDFSSTYSDVLAFQKQWYEALPEDQKESLKSGFGSHEQSMLEEAVAYVPLSMYLYLSRIPLLLKAPYSGHRLAKDIEVMGETCRRKFLIEARTASPLPPLSEGRSPSLTPPPPLCLYHLEGGDYKTSKSVNQACEDATFCLPKEGIFGIFDGVGSWSLEGIDASEFSSGLADICTLLGPTFAESTGSLAGYNATRRARLLLQQAHATVQKTRPSAWGSSTAIVAVFDRFLGTLGVACLGDSSLMVLRRDTMPRELWRRELAECPKASYQTLLGTGTRIPRKMRRILWKTKEQRWENGAPYQLSNLPPPHEWEGLRERGYSRFIDTLYRVDSAGDSWDMAFSPRFPIACQPGDLIVAFSDGVSDNLFEEELETYCSFAVSPEEAYQMGDKSLSTPAETVAKVITAVAKRRSVDQVFKQAFVPLNESKESLYGEYDALSNRITLKGGKRDDISCVACWVEAETKENIDSMLAEQYASLSSRSHPTAASLVTPPLSSKAAPSLPPSDSHSSPSSPSPLSFPSSKNPSRSNVSPPCSFPVPPKRGEGGPPLSYGESPSGGSPTSVRTPLLSKNDTLPTSPLPLPSQPSKGVVTPSRPLPALQPPTCSNAMEEATSESHPNPETPTTITAVSHTEAFFTPHTPNSEKKQRRPSTALSTPMKSYASHSGENSAASPPRWLSSAWEVGAKPLPSASTYPVSQEAIAPAPPTKNEVPPLPSQVTELPKEDKEAFPTLLLSTATSPSPPSPTLTPKKWLNSRGGREDAGRLAASQRVSTPFPLSPPIPSAFAHVLRPREGSEGRGRKGGMSPLTTPMKQTTKRCIPSADITPMATIKVTKKKRILPPGVQGGGSVEGGGLATEFPPPPSPPVRSGWTLSSPASTAGIQTTLENITLQNVASKMRVCYEKEFVKSPFNGGMTPRKIVAPAVSVGKRKKK